MIDIALLLFFSYRLHQLAEQKGLPPWSAVIKFVLTYFGMLILFSIWLVIIYGAAVFNTPDLMKQIAPFLPIVFAVEISLFLYFRYRISKLPDQDAGDEPDEESKQKPDKDLSYFR